MPKVATPEEEKITKKKKEEIAQGKNYENPGQWLGNKHPITRTDK